MNPQWSDEVKERYTKDQAFYADCAARGIQICQDTSTVKLAIRKKPWVGLTDEDDLDWEEGGSLKDLVKAIESKLKEKNDGREWQDLTDDEMLMIYGQNHEGKKYNLGRMVQQALKDKNT